jgi:branched-chain amino acid transport system permease protein
MEQIINGLSIGCTYLLIALGFNIIFGVQRIVNLAYGEVFMVAAYAAASIASIAPGSTMLLIPTAIIAAVGVGLLVYILAVKPLGPVTDLNAPRHLSVIVSTIGFSFILQNATIWHFGAYPRPFPRFLGGSGRSSTVFNLGVAAIISLVLYLGFRYTRTGLRLRAIADNPELALCTGIRGEADKLLAVSISSALAGVAALLICQQIGAVSPFIGNLYGFKALIVVIVGGLGNMVGAATVAILLGLAETTAVQFVGSSYRDGIAFALLIVVLVIRNRGVRIGEFQ